MKKTTSYPFFIVLVGLVGVIGLVTVMVTVSYSGMTLSEHDFTESDQQVVEQTHRYNSMDNNHTGNHSMAVDHTGHQAAMNGDMERSIAHYQVPDVSLINQDGKVMKLSQILDPEKFVVVDFIFTTCTTVCPVLSSGLSSFQDKLGSEMNNVKIVSITIDPEHDKPEVLREYSRKYSAASGREFLTGSREDINTVMKAFDAFMPNKMTHYPLTFIRAPGEHQWIRVMGLMGTSDLIKEYQEQITI